jgi:hypothetical protein
MPNEQPYPSGHKFPHVPQFDGSVFTSVHAPPHTSYGYGPHTQELPEQVVPRVHVLVHVTGCPQLLVAVPQASPLHGVVLSGVQQLPSAMQTSAADAQLPLLPHRTICPQLFVALPHDLPAHVMDTGSGVHPHEPFMHIRPPPQAGHRIVCPQLSITLPHRPAHNADGGVGLQHV